ncbi:MBOAT family O-acyltransferase [Flectobacillus major]|uniref:MBOAT family O-acyltransferase n=1 Tax=Flectobacillus major TaxID=103 RepID=UPI0004033E3D|nr:MBOAT family O-acyltransferase [Flectobacillus major]
MPFNTLKFVYFFAFFFPIYWAAKKNTTLQNSILIIGSLVFYGWDDYRLSVLLVAISIFCWIGAIAITKLERFKVFIYYFVITSLLFQLFICKYYHWILGERHHNITWYSFTTTVGISYYILAAYSYVTDVYREKLRPSFSIINLLAYFSFFPQLLSGPIPIAYRDLAQYAEPKNLSLESTEQAIQRIIWGLFKKVIVSSTLATPVDYIFYNHDALEAPYLWLGVFLYSFQVYMDFSGYSDMAWGLARLLGIKINPNFNAPFISRSIDEFWRRWHLSLSAWLKEYIYIPLGGRGKFKLQYCFNVLAVFFISGLWHGANSTYILWGTANGLLFVISILLGLTRNPKNQNYTWKNLLPILLVFISISLTRVFFRSPNLTSAILYYQEMFKVGQLNIPDIGHEAMLLSLGVVLVEFFQRNQIHTADIQHKPLYLRAIIYAIMLGSIIYFWPAHNSTEYIYFKF